MKIKELKFDALTLRLKLIDVKYFFVSPIRRFFGNIYRIFVYIPIIWKDRDWDHIFFLEFMNFKLKRMSKYFLKSNIIVDSEKVAREIEYASSLLEKIIEDDFFKDEYNALCLKYPRNNLIDENNHWRGWSEEESKVYSAHYKKCEEEKQRITDEFFSYIKDNYEKWWD